MKRLLTALFSLLLFFMAVPSIHAQTIPPFISQPSIQPTPTFSPLFKTTYPLQTDNDVPQNFHTYSQNVFIEILTSASCILAGYDPLTASGKCLGINPATHKIGYVDGGQGGAIGIVGNMIGMTFNIPVSTSVYVKDVAANFGISKTSYAVLPAEEGDTSSSNFSSGYGYGGLKPVLAVWKIFRNLVYLILVLIFIIIGLGIMFRVNVDARSVMTIQNQLPKIIIGIILVTLSYAIAGFIVDMMYVSMYLVYYLFAQQALSLDVANLNPSQLQGTNPLSALGGLGGLGGASNIAFGAAKPFGHVVSSLFDNKFGQIISAIVGGIIGGIIPGVGFLTGPLAAIGGWFVGSKVIGMVGGLIAYIIMLVAILIAMFRLWFLLLKSYIFFLVDVVLSPFWIGLGLLPKGASAGFGSWIRDIVANLAVFPASLFMLLLGKTIVNQFSSAATSRSFVPPLIGNPGNAGDFGAIIGFGFILLLPSVVTMVRDTLKAPGLKYTQAIGQTLGVGTGAVQKPFSGFKNELFGKNQDGTPKIGSKFMGQKFSRVAGILTGGGIGIDKEGKDAYGGPTGRIAKLSHKYNPIRRIKERGREKTNTNTNIENKDAPQPGLQQEQNKQTHTTIPPAVPTTKPVNEDSSTSQTESNEYQELERQAIENVKSLHNAEPAVTDDVFIQNHRDEINAEINRLKNDQEPSTS